MMHARKAEHPASSRRRTRGWRQPQRSVTPSRPPTGRAGRAAAAHHRRGRAHRPHLWIHVSPPHEAPVHSWSLSMMWRRGYHCARQAALLPSPARLPHAFAMRQPLPPRHAPCPPRASLRRARPRRYAFAAAQPGLGPALFLPWAAWVCVWTAALVLALAVCNASGLIDKFTRFSGETFGMLIAVLFMQARGARGRRGRRRRAAAGGCARLRWRGRPVPRVPAAGDTRARAYQCDTL